MKFTKISQGLGKFFIGLVYVFMILLVLGLFGVLIWVDLFMLRTPVFNIMWFCILPAIGLIINWFIGFFFKDKYYNTGMVIDGRSVLDVVKTPKYYKRRIFVCFAECFLFVLLAIKNIVFLYLNPIWSIIGIVGGIIGAVIYFIVAMSSIELSKTKNTEK